MTEPHIRTSETHPIRIDAVQPLGGWGLIGLSFCPGKKQMNALTGAWHRDLTLDMGRIHDWGAAMVVTLIESSEFNELEVEGLGAEVELRGMQWRHLPIRDRYPPGSPFEAGWPQVGTEAVGLLKAGKRVFVHCKGGLGRAGTVAACLLVESGMHPEEAIKQVRIARPRAIETTLQEWYVLNYRPRLR